MTVTITTTIDLILRSSSIACNGDNLGGLAGVSKLSRNCCSLLRHLFFVLIQTKQLLVDATDGTGYKVDLGRNNRANSIILR